MNIGDLLKAFLTNLKAWAQSVGVGLVAAIYLYFHGAAASGADPVSALVTGAILTAIVKALGALIRKWGGTVPE